MRPSNRSTSKRNSYRKRAAAIEAIETTVAALSKEKVAMAAEMQSIKALRESEQKNMAAGLARLERLLEKATNAENRSRSRCIKLRPEKPLSCKVNSSSPLTEPARKNWSATRRCFDSAKTKSPTEKPPFSRNRLLQTRHRPKNPATTTTAATPAEDVCHEDEDFDPSME